MTQVCQACTTSIVKSQELFLQRAFLRAHLGKESKESGMWCIQNFFWPPLNIEFRQSTTSGLSPKVNETYAYRVCSNILHKVKRSPGYVCSERHSSLLFSCFSTLHRCLVEWLCPMYEMPNEWLFHWLLGSKTEQTPFKEGADWAELAISQSCLVKRQICVNWLTLG